VTTITKKFVDGFVPNFMRRFLWEREDQVRVLLRSVEVCVSNGQKNSLNGRLFTFYTSNTRCDKFYQVLATWGALQRGPGGPWPTQNFGWVGHNALGPTNIGMYVP